MRCRSWVSIRPNPIHSTVSTDQESQSLAAREIHVPDLGSFKGVAVIEVLVKAGDRVAVDTPLLTLETEKATMDVPSPAAGVIDKLLVKKGDRVSAGTPIAILAGATAATPPPV